MKKNEHTIPSGNEIGILMHYILENLPFPTAKTYNNSNDFVEAITPYFQQSPFTAWKEVIAKMVYTTLTTPLPGCSFSLADVHADKTYRETEFLFPCNAKETSFHDVRVKTGFIKGVIDLFFEHEGKYYLVDWKSNWLGPSHASYTRNNLLQAMSLNRYDIQATIYMQAMERYLKLFDDRPFHDIFGGTFYIFLRGVTTETGILRSERRQ